MALARLAEAKHAALAFEASVAGGIPIVKTLREGLAGNSIQRVYGILNGTCNYILSRMERDGLSFDQCLSEAQRLGYAEADPTFDIGGFDTAHKLSILASLAFGVEVNSQAVSVEGIEQITLADLHAAEELGYRIKLLGVAQRTAHGVEQRVHPTMVPRFVLYRAGDGRHQRRHHRRRRRDEFTLVGPGAGGAATASAVVADIADIAKGVRSAPSACRSRRSPGATFADAAPRGRLYIRLAAKNRPGSAAAIATRMAERNISLESIVQRRQPGEKRRRRSCRLC